jgi:hypothetical protein
MDESLKKEYDFLFVDNIETPFKIQPSDLTDSKKYSEILKTNNNLKIENDKIAEKCLKIKEEVMKIKEMMEKIKNKVEDEKLNK